MAGIFLAIIFGAIVCAFFTIIIDFVFGFPLGAIAAIIVGAVINNTERKREVVSLVMGAIVGMGVFLFVGSYFFNFISSAFVGTVATVVTAIIVRSCL